MTRKTIAITIPGAAETLAPPKTSSNTSSKTSDKTSPKTSANAPRGTLPEPGGLTAAPAIDNWISQDGPKAEAAPAVEPAGAGLSLHYRLSPTPNLAEAAQILFVLPQAALLYWSLAAARRSLNIAASFTSHG